VRGISRSGSTVCVGLWSGLDPVAAAEFSFLWRFGDRWGGDPEGRHAAVNITP